MLVIKPTMLPVMTKRVIKVINLIVLIHSIDPLISSSSSSSASSSDEQEDNASEFQLESSQSSILFVLMS